MKTLASGSWDKTLKMWDAGSGKLVSSQGGHGHFLNTVAFSCDGNYISSGTDKNSHHLKLVANYGTRTRLGGHVCKGLRNCYRINSAKERWK